MFEIGTSLREARLRQGLDFPEIEAETKIRGKYMRALEEEQFDVLPGETYVRGFLRTYAEYLGLDGQLYVDEYNSRFTTADEPVVVDAAARRKPPRRHIESNLVIAALAGIVAVTVLAVIGLTGLGGDGEPPAEPNLTDARPTETQPAQQPAASPPPKKAARPAAARRIRLSLTAARGNCWLQARAGGVNGNIIWEGTLEQGKRLPLTKWRRVWLNLGNPANLDARLGQHLLGNFPTEQSVVVVSARGVRVLSQA